MNEIYVVDAVGYLFRSYYAIRGMTNLEGQSTNALYGFIRSVQKVFKDFSPDYFVCVFDGPNNKASRTAIYKEYKSHREGMPEDLAEQLKLAHKFCKLAGIPMLSEEGVEADDVMGSIAKWAEAAGANVHLLSSDKDLCQLITDKIDIINTHKNNLRIDAKKALEIHGVKPEKMIDLLGIMGDSADNIPGLPGFGPKTAKTMLEQFGTLEEMLARPEEIKSAKKSQAVIDNADLARLSKVLATIQLDVPFPQESSFFHLKEPEYEELRAFYEEMDFRALLKELKKPTKEAPSGKYHLIDDESELEKLLSELSKAECICVDTETTSLEIMKARIVGVGLGAVAGEAFYIPLNGKIGEKRALDLLKPFLEGQKIYGHNIKYDLHALANHDIFPKHVCYDTMIASYTLHAERRGHSLDGLSLDLFGFVKTETKSLLGTGKKAITMLEVEIEKVSDYCCEDIDYTIRLKEHFDAELNGEEKLKELFETIELPLLDVLFKMERKGIFVDREELKSLSIDFTNRIDDLAADIHHLAGGPFNIKSTKQLGEVLFETLDIGAKKKRTATGGYSTSGDVLEGLVDEHPIIPLILEFRLFEKLRSTYVDALPEQIDEASGRIHPTFTQTVTATGRLACQNPNLQNIPVRSEQGRKIRDAFIPQGEQMRFVAFDYSQIELRILAHLSCDPTLIRAFNEGKDIHRYTASLVYGIPIEEVQKEMRFQAKAVNFGIIYGQGPYGLAKETGMTNKEASRFIETYFERYPKVKEFMEGCKESARESGASYTTFGRRRILPDINAKNGMLRAGAERFAVNSPIQGTQADIIKMAMIAIDKRLKGQAKMILQIHDELIFECPLEEIEELKSLVVGEMQEVFPLQVPLKVDIKIGKNWGEC